MTQSIRPSQFIVTYGPGAILESQDGPIIIPTPDNGIFTENSSLDPNDYLIDSERMSKGLLQGAKIFKLPTNASLSLSNDEFIYRTKPFPNWNLCLNRDLHPNNVDSLYLGNMCPVCKDPTGGRQDAIRFVMVCRNGHLNDVDWNYLVHGGNDCSHANINNIDRTLRNPYVFQWNRTGGALKNINIECPRCGTRKNFGQAYYKDWHCSGRYPERETVSQQPVTQPGCNEVANIMQRQASNIRIPEIKTLLSIQSTYTKLNQLIQNEKIKNTIKSSKTFLGDIDSVEKFKKVIEAMRNVQVPENSIREFESSPWDEIKQAISDLESPVPENYHELIMDEFRQLLKSSKEGAPPKKSKSKPIFEVNKHDIKTFEIGNGTVFRVTPISTLETITVQLGYRRAVSEDSPQTIAPLVNTDFMDKLGEKWYPGASFLGEGIFLSIENEEWLDSIDGDAVSKWKKSHHESDKYREFLFRDPTRSRDEIHPAFVWWHTLSHLLIRTISEEAGYSSASIRERIYLDLTGNKLNGGILLYATQPGSEGTLGGLTGLTPIFDFFLNIALESAKTCSADPICAEQKFKHLGINGSCCYGCLMNSETSCEHRNMWLDREILMDNMP